jgi:Tol biopolymer transport system component/tRNA A-37 threonylcarbamoyl transferase component Bud32
MQPGHLLAHYEISEQLGQGGMGVVYKARDTRLDRPVAIKVLPADRMSDPDRVRRFTQEARTASNLNHPNIITIHDVSSEDDTHFIVMEYVRGKTLDELIPRRGMRLPEALKIAIQIADALATAAAAGVIHRDVKPGNVMVTETGFVKVLDFGLAKLVERSHTAHKPDDTETMEEEAPVAGTAAYMSPEQAEGKPVDGRSDVFSFGALLYELLTGQRAFQGETRMSTIAAILNKDPKPASEMIEELPRDAEKIIRRCLRKDPARRFQTMADLKVALEDLKEESDSGALARPAPVKAPSRRKWWWAAALGVVLIGAGASLTPWRRSRNDTAPAAMRIVPLTALPGQESQPTFSPDGNQVAFRWIPEGQSTSDIYIQMVGQGAPVRLTSDPASDSQPAWSPDGRWIAFMRQIEPGHNALKLAAPFGGGERQIAEFRSLGRPIAWSPDSKWIAASESVERRPSSIVVISVETGEMRQASSPPGQEGPGDSAPAFSPDGRNLAFARFGDLYIQEMTSGVQPTGELRRVYSGTEPIQRTAWMPDGAQILFASSYEGSGALWRVDASGPGTPQKLEVGSDNTGDIALVSRPSGIRVAFTARHQDVNLWRYVVAEGGKPAAEPVNFLSSTRTEMDPAWSADGKRIAFVSDRSGRFEVWVAGADGSNLIQATDLRGQSAQVPKWSPDGREIVFGLGAPGSRQIMIVPSAGGPARVVRTKATGDHVLAWSRDGKSIYFISHMEGASGVWRYTLATGKETLVTATPAHDAAESLDGRFLYFANRNKVWRVPVDGGQETEVAGVLIAGPDQIAMTRDGFFFVAEMTPDRRAIVHFYSFTTGATSRVLTTRPSSVPAGGRPPGFAASPEGRWLLFPSVDQSSSDLMMIENFR